MPLTAVNAKVVSAHVSPGAPVLARRGAMLAYTGRVAFRPVTGSAGRGRGGSGGGGSGLGALGGALGRAAAGEGSAMMLAEGDGEVLYGLEGLHVVVVDLDGREDLTVEADRLLAHDGSLDPSIVFLGSGGSGVRGGLGGLARGAMTGQGLFTTRLSGTGSVALLAHGGAFPLTVREGAPVGVDPQAYVAHTGALRVEVTASLGWRDAVGRGSGEAFQLRVGGHGTVHVQASERKV